LWIMENDKDLFNKSYGWLSPQDYLISRLLGKITVTHGSVLRNGYYNIAKRELAKDIFGDNTPDFIRLDSRGIGEKIGKVKVQDKIARYLEDAYMVSVPGDQPSGLLGSGVADTGDLAMNLGTTFVLSLLSKKYFLGNKKITNEILPNGYYAPEFGSGAGGQFMDWIVELLYGSTDIGQVWQELDKLVQTIPPGSDGLCIVPLLWQVTSPNVQGGIKRISSIHTRAHIVRAAYEGLAYEARISLETIEEAGKGSDIRVYGGMSSLLGFLQILANVTNKNIIVSRDKEASALGAALTAATAIGAFDNIIEASKSRHDKVEKIIRPKAMEVDYYDREFERYKRDRG
ncbi:MAG: FGGY-family carbohydrate kinase, partial [Tissierellaceae bacterium]